jgi:hypothetical protein
MPRKKKISFQLDPEWMLKSPVDFEFNKYTLLDYIQKCEKRFEKLEIYPDFVELSLHLANLQSLTKEKTLLLTDKKFNSCDDEILLKELYPKKPRDLSKEEEEQLDKTIMYSGNKLFDTFNIGKSIWNLAFDNIFINLKKNRDSLHLGKGFCYFVEQDTRKLYIWQYEIKKDKKKGGDHKTTLTLIFENTLSENSITELITNFSTWKNDVTIYPIFEIKSKIAFPMEQTFVPMMKRKILTFIFQVANAELMKSFDSLPKV